MTDTKKDFLSIALGLRNLRTVQCDGRMLGELHTPSAHLGPHQVKTLGLTKGSFLRSSANVCGCTHEDGVPSFSKNDIGKSVSPRVSLFAKIFQGLLVPLVLYEVLDGCSSLIARTMRHNRYLNFPF